MKLYDNYRVLMSDLTQYNEASEIDNLEPVFARFYVMVEATSKQHAVELAENLHQDCEAINAEKV